MKFILFCRVLQSQKMILLITIIHSNLLRKEEEEDDDDDDDDDIVNNNDPTSSLNSYNEKFDEQNKLTNARKPNFYC